MAANQPSPSDRIKAFVGGISWAWITTVVLTVVLLWVVGKQVLLSANGHEFSPLETTSYSVAQVLLSVALSLLFSKISFDATQRQYADAAVRRLVSFKQSVAHLRKVIAERRHKIETANANVSAELLSEFFTHCDSLAQELDRDATNSIQDWGGAVGATMSGMAFLSDLEQAKVDAEGRAKQLEVEMQMRIAQLTGENAQARDELAKRYENDIKYWRQRASDAEAAKDSLGRLGQLNVSGSTFVPGVEGHKRLLSGSMGESPLSRVVMSFNPPAMNTPSKNVITWDGRKDPKN